MLSVTYKSNYRYERAMLAMAGACVIGADRPWTRH